MSELGGVEGDDRSSERTWETEPELPPVTDAMLSTTGDSGAMPASVTKADAAPDGDVANEPPGEAIRDGRGESDRAVEHDKVEAYDKPEPEAIDKFLQSLGASVVKELCWRAIESGADAFVPGASMFLEGAKIVYHVVKNFDKLEKADGFDIEVPVYVSEIIPIGLSLKGSYSEDPNAGTLTLRVQGSLSLDDAPTPFLPEINPSASDHEPTPGQGQAHDLPPTTAQPEHRDVDEMDTAIRHTPRKLVRTRELAAESRELGGVDVVLAVVPGRIANREHPYPSPQTIGLPSPVGIPGQSEIKGRQEAGRTSQPRVLMLVIDGLTGHATFHYCDPDGWLHLVAILIAENSRDTLH